MPSKPTPTSLDYPLLGSCLRERREGDGSPRMDFLNDYEVSLRSLLLASLRMTLTLFYSRSFEEAASGLMSVTFSALPLPPSSFISILCGWINLAPNFSLIWW